MQRSARALEEQKRTKCKFVTENEKKIFAKVKSDESDENDDENPPKRQLTDTEKKEIDEKVGQFIFNETLPLLTARSPSFISLVKALNPEYGKHIPSAYEISNKILNDCYNLKFEDLRKVIDESNGITLVTDCYTDFMQNHFMNFVIKIPTKSKTYFYKLIDTNKIDQIE